jgi:CheY-like chemotaxis protein
MEQVTILVVEDNPDILEAERLILELEGFTVITAEDGLIGIDNLAIFQPDVILTDLMLPKMTGLEFIRLVRSMADYDDIAIIAISAAGQSYLAQAIEAGAQGALHKPEDIDNLVSTINQVLAGKCSRGLLTVGVEAA